jgi:AcrR family transcriptional regulator
MPERGPLPDLPPWPDVPVGNGNRDNVETRTINSAWNRLFKMSAAELSLEEIAKEIGVTARAVHYYYRGRHLLAEAIAVRALQTLHELVITRDEWNRISPRPLIEFVTAYVGFATRRPRHFGLAYSPDYADKEAFPTVETWRYHLLDAEYRLLGRELGREPQGQQILHFAALLRGSAELAIDYGLDVPAILSSIHRFIADARQGVYVTSEGPLGAKEPEKVASVA